MESLIIENTVENEEGSGEVRAMREKYSFERFEQMAREVTEMRARMGEMGREIERVKRKVG